ncbi:MAG: T9SS type A sorting domain-containing protein [Flavobacteriales bacterium]|nr:T9SS type A sorting domain-containing protein [Flavobacteriales bacterium]
MANINNDINVGGGPGGGTIYGLKSFITARSNYLRNALDCSTIGVQELRSPVELSVYPNPVTDVLHVVLPTGYSAEDLRLLDALGRSMPVSHSGSAIDLSGLASGAYVIMVDGPSGKLTLRVVKN